MSGGRGLVVVMKERDEGEARGGELCFKRPCHVNAVRAADPASRIAHQCWQHRTEVLEIDVGAYKC